MIIYVSLIIQSDFREPIRRITGNCNNLQRANDGASLIPFAKLLPPVYDDGFYFVVSFCDPKNLQELEPSEHSQRTKLLHCLQQESSQISSSNRYQIEYYRYIYIYISVMYFIVVQLPNEWPSCPFRRILIRWTPVATLTCWCNSVRWSPTISSSPHHRQVSPIISWFSKNMMHFLISKK